MSNTSDTRRNEEKELARERRKAELVLLAVEGWVRALFKQPENLVSTRNHLLDTVFKVTRDD